MAGFREFVTGEVLTAANVDDFLAKQAVMKFADAAARDTALGTAVAGGNALREGMVAWLDSDDELQAYDGTAWASVGGSAGIGSNVVSVTKVDTFSTSSKTFVDVTGLTVTITPTTATSKVLVMASLSISNPTNEFGVQGALLEGSTVIGGTPVSNRPSGTFFSNRSANDRDGFAPLHFVTLREPATTDPITYKIQIRTDQDGATTASVNVSSNDENTANRPRLASSITVIEVSA